MTIELHTWSTPNGRKASIMLEEVGLPYEVFPVNIGTGEQFEPKFLELSPNNRIPAIRDTDNGLTLFESGAILMYLAQKSGKLWPADGEAHWRTIEWLMWQMGGFGPMLGQAHHFLKYNVGKAPYAEERYGTEAKRLWGVLDKRLGEVEYVAGEYTIADIAIFPWAARFEWQRIDLNEYLNAKRWYLALAARPAVQRGYIVPDEKNQIPMP
ncbi:MAG: glutathione S-transferase N-terminal domain-containing protein [Alphaproteobacteria bacterium]|nr:glutathione S-transferase N-terminal domain-containing protein [Alphaproteobacteria bacterium]